MGAFEKALDRLDIPYEILKYCEVNPYPALAYSILHNVPLDDNLGDISKVDETKLDTDIDLITYGFPCQDISSMGRQAGFEDADGNQTRSGLFFDALRIIEHCKPKIAIAENVKNLTGKRFKTEFKEVLDGLEAAGYNNYWRVLNAKGFGAAQNRERVFIVSIREDVNTTPFIFPFSFPTPIKLDDVLEEQVEEKFFLNDTQITGLLNSVFNATRAKIQRKDICGALMASDYKGPKCVAVKDDTGAELIRKLTPKEYFRLQGFDDTDVDKLIENGLSNSQLYKMAGNSISVPVLEHLLRQIWGENNEFRI